MATTEYLEEDQKRLFPRIRSRDDIEDGRLGLAFEEPGTVSDWCRPGLALGDHLVAELVLQQKWEAPDNELDGAIVSVGHEELKSWEVTFEDAFSDSLNNLSKKTTGKCEELKPGLYSCNLGDYHDNARILLPDLFSDIKLDGDPVVVVPNRDVFLVTGSENVEGLRMLDHLAWCQYEENYYISPVSLIRRNNAWQTYAPTDRPDLAMIAGTKKMWYSQIYLEKREALAVAFPGFVIPFYCTASAEGDDEVTSFSVIHADRPTLAANSDVVIFVEDRAKLLGVLGFEQAKEVLGDTLQQYPGIWPTRYRFSGKLSDIPLRKICTAPIDEWCAHVVKKIILPKIAKEAKEVFVASNSFWGDEEEEGDRILCYLTARSLGEVRSTMKRVFADVLEEHRDSPPASVQMYLNLLDDSKDKAKKLCLKQRDAFRKQLAKQKLATEVTVGLIEDAMATEAHSPTNARPQDDGP